MPPEIQTEAQAEDALFAAILAPDEQVLDELKLDPPQDVDETEEGAEGADSEPQAKPEAKAKAEEAAPEEDEVEIPGEEGAEPKRVKVADLVASHAAYEKLRGQEAQIIERVETEATQRVTAHYKQVSDYTQQVGLQVQAALQLLQPPQPPSPELIDPNSPRYNPDGYHLAFANYQRAHGQYQQAQAVGKQLLDAANDANARATDARETQELQRALRVWPEFGQPDTQQKFISDMGKAYGYSPQELDASLTDHRNLQVARDALAFRAMKAQSGDVRKQVEAKAPKLVRSKQESKGGGAGARDDKGRFASESLAAAKKSGTDDAWARHFAELSRQGRI